MNGEATMKYIFFGTPRFAEIVLRGLILNGGMPPPVALVCNPDRPLGRKHIITPPPTKQLIQKSQTVSGENAPTKILQPEKLDENFIAELRALAPDFFVVAAYAKIIPASVLAIPRLGTLGTHPSLLPQYRGASPIQSAILAGETTTGSTIYQMDEKMDHGGIFTQGDLPLDALATNYLALEEQLATLSAELLIKIIPTLLDGTAQAQTQDESLATFTKKFTTESGFVKESELDAALAGNSDKTELILRTIHALTPEPGAWTIKDGKRIKLLEARIDGGALKFIKIQEEGQKPRQA